MARKKLKPLMIVGTGSNVGKSIIVSGFGRIFLQDGYNPAPFKAQNMSLNSYVTADGGEIGRAQASQAEACGIGCTTDMNPILLKPNTDTDAQVILDGKPIGNYQAIEYFKGNFTSELFPYATQAFHRLSKQYSPIIMEGAGSISELNLKKNDIVNIPMAIAANASVVVVGDIDKGGVIGSLYGNIMLLTPDERKHIKGIIVNKFRGDISLFDEGKRILEELTGVPVLGIIPSFDDIYLEEEDALADKNLLPKSDHKLVKVAVILLPKMSNFTDFDRLALDSRVHLFFAHKPEQLKDVDIVILPGSKSTISDLLYLYETGMAKAIQKIAHENDKSIIGICGGYQMMGKEIHDPHQTETHHTYIQGLNILPISTTMNKEKKTLQTEFYFQNEKEICYGYEIHMGKTIPLTKINTLNKKTDNKYEGVWLTKQCWGTYMHGILDNETVIESILSPYTKEKSTAFDYAKFKDQNYNKLADWIRNNIDMEKLYTILEEE